MTYDTNNPVPSNDPRDLDDNAEAFDRFLQSDAASEPDRLGVQRKTWHQMELDAEGLVSPNVAALAAVIAAVDQGVFFNSATPVGMGVYTLTSFVRSLSGAANPSAFRTAIGAVAASDNITGSAAKLTTARSIAVTGDASWSVSFDGSAGVTGAITLAPTGVTAGTYGLVTVNAKGLVTGGVASTAFANLSLQNSWLVTAGRRAGYRKYLDMVYLEVNIANGVATDGTLIATLPVGFRPLNSFAIPVASSPNVAPAIGGIGPRVIIDADGTIKCQNCGNSLLGFVASFSLV